MTAAGSVPPPPSLSDLSDPPHPPHPFDPSDLAGVPSWHPPREVLEAVELQLTGVVARLVVPLTPPEDRAGAPLVLEDAEGTPVAVVQADGRLQPLRAFTQGPVRSARRTPAQVRAELTPGTGGVLAVPVTSLLTAATVQTLTTRAAAAGQALLWLAVLGTGRRHGLPPEGLWRAVRALAHETGSLAVPVVVPVAAPETAPGTAAADDELLREVARAYGATEVVDGSEPASGGAEPAALHPAFERERERAVAPPHRRGVTVFFTGLSGSGKSTVAKALADELAERSDRTVSLLDGDEVRRLLSAGLGFSRADRDLNIRRIGFVATEICRHGGLAICAPIAPFARTREQVRADVETVGDLVLVHISTPLAECERRDRKGLYAKARQGLIPEFTGISSPYEVPVDADLRLDTSRMEVAEAVAAVWELLRARGYVSDLKVSSHTFE
jgi:sulfate adenylyltransferase